MLSSFSIKHADKTVRARAAEQIKATLVVSFIPLVLGFLAIMTVQSFGGAVLKVFFSGELYFYAMSVCATIYVTGQMSYHRENSSMRLWSGAFVLFCAAFMSFYIGQSALSEDEFLFHRIAPIVLLGLAIIVCYRVMVLAEQPPPMPEEVNRQRVSEMTKKVDPDYD